MRKNTDILLIVQILAIGAISLLIIFSINKNLAFNQGIFWLFGLAILWIFSQFDYKNWQNLSGYFYIFSIISLLLLLIFAHPVRGSTRWMDLGVFRFQPAEVAKAAAILLLANFFSMRSAKVIKNLILSLLIILPAIILIFVQPDIGNTLAFLAIWLGISTAAGFKLKHLITLTLVAIVFGVLFFELLAPYQKARLFSFVNPNADPLGTGYNLIQSKIAVGSGNFFGRGLGQGTQSQLNFLPEAESDFIFASISEQLGFIGAGLLLILYLWLMTKLLQISKNRSRYAQLIVIGTFSFLLLQFSISIAMNMGLLPVTGITLPLVSYGGSSLIMTLFLLGIVLSTTRYS